MLLPRRAWLALTIWLSVISTGLTQEGPAPMADRSLWLTLIDGAPALWNCISVAAILTATFALQLFFMARKSRVNPSALIEALTRAIQAGNYQEAWEICHQWRQTALARMLQPALERIGQGLEPVQSRLTEEARRERRHFSLLLWGLMGSAALVFICCLLAIYSEYRGLAAAAMSSEAPRVRTLALGNVAMLVGVVFAVVLPAVVSWIWLKVQSVTLLTAAREQSVQLVAGLPYEEIEGVRIGRDFHAGTIFGESGGSQSNRLQVSKELTSLCPSCNGPINPSRPSCLHCGQLLTWS